MNLVQQCINSYRYKGWNLLETVFYFFKRVSSKIGITNLFWKNIHQQISIYYFKNKWLEKSDDVFIFNFNGVKLPDVSMNKDMLGGLKYVFDDVFIVPVFFNDDYSKKNVEFVDQFTAEGPYGYKDETFDVTIKKGDVVFDVGAWIGDFSAYAAWKGATTYAFEPTRDTYDWLCKTVRLNDSSIIPIHKGLGNEITKMRLSTNGKNGGSNTLMRDTQDGGEFAEMTTVDAFVADSKLSRVDFIKADIEGFERYMLMGARETLKNFAPKLTICTYHLSDDPEILEKIIRDANSQYKIVHLQHKLFASVD